MNVRQRLISWDSLTGLVFAALGGALLIASARFPPAVAGVPGPGFFPMLTGVLLLVLGCALAVQGMRHARRYWEKPWSDPAVRRIVAVLAAVGAYVLLWEVVPFLWRTPAMLAAVYIVLGERWRRAIALAAVITAVLYGAFELLLEVRL